MSGKVRSVDGEFVPVASPWRDLSQRYRFIYRTTLFDRTQSPEFVDDLTSWRFLGRKT
jgi:hypothetical protein